jgi:serine protease
MIGRGSAPTIRAINAKDLHFRGGVSGVGVTTGAPKVYLVFWGSQWGTQGTNSAGNATFTGDPQGLAPYLQAFFKGLGTGGELWSGVMTQYCEGVATGSTSCPTSAAHVGYPAGGALAGVWEDAAALAPANATQHQLAAEAANASSHFHNLTSVSNRNNQYFVVSPTGTDPDNYLQNNFCAWHDYTGDTTLIGGPANGPGTPLAFTNMPYVPDATVNCGAGFINPGNTLDGVSIVGGHEYAETITDQFPSGGWTANDGKENGDLCAWKTSGAGKAQDITLGGHPYAVQGTWSNVANRNRGACAIKNPIVT